MCTTRIFLLVLWVSCISCDNEGAHETLDAYAFRQPTNFPSATYTFENNPITKEGFELGRMLFYDPILSSDSTVSCSTCHRQSTGFADPTHRINHGVANRFGKRNSPGIVNMAFRTNFFYDGGVTHLDFVPINAITSPVEMDNTLEELIKRLQRHPMYAAAFSKAFGTSNIDSQKILFALAQFTTMIVSDQSKYDQVQRGEAVFSAEESAGYALFQSKCATCHSGTLFTDDEFHNNGLDPSFERDAGRKIITNDELDAGKFRVPSLRNVAVTPPYMHDGRFNTLLDVMNHYLDGVEDSPTLDPLLKQGDVRGIMLTPKERNDLLAFLETLTDHTLLKDLKLSDPF